VDVVIGEVLDDGVGFGVDGDDRIRVVHADLVLDGTGDPGGDVEVGFDFLAGLADLAVHLDVLLDVAVELVGLSSRPPVFPGSPGRLS
jgi:hypothetical protein